MKVYFKTEWLVKHINVNNLGIGGSLMFVAKLAKNADCRLIMCPYREWIKNDIGCYVIPFNWQAPSRATFEQCLQDITQFMTFSNIQEISSQEFESGRQGEFLQDLTGLGALDLVLYIEELAESNDNILS